MISMKDALRIADEAVRIYRDTTCSIEDSVNAAKEIYEEIKNIEKESIAI